MAMVEMAILLVTVFRTRALEPNDHSTRNRWMTTLRARCSTCHKGRALHKAKKLPIITRDYQYLTRIGQQFMHVTCIISDKLSTPTLSADNAMTKVSHGGHQLDKSCG